MKIKKFLIPNHEMIPSSCDIHLVPYERPAQKRSFEWSPRRIYIHTLTKENHFAVHNQNG